MAELILKECLEKAQTESNISYTSNDMNIELSKKFLMELQKNTYHGMLHEDVMDHIAKVLEMLDLINIPSVDSHQLRMKKFFCKFYPESYDGEEEMLDEGDNWGIDTLEFISRVNSSFDKHMKVGGRTKKWTIKLRHPKRETWTIKWDGGSNTTTTDSFFKPYMKASEKNDTEKDDEQSQTKRKCDNTSNSINEQPNKRMRKEESLKL
ncbi:hypothetical protein Tco_0642918 [Tanacetum coccineum]